MSAITLQREPAAAGIDGGRLARRLAKAGFWFFFIKGLLWLVAPAVAWVAMS